MSEEFASVTFAVLHQLSNNLTAAEGYSSLLDSQVPDRKLTKLLQQSLTQAQILLQSLESSRRLLRQSTITQQPVVLESILTNQLRELNLLLSRHKITVETQRIYHAPAVLTDRNYTIELIRLILGSFVLNATTKTIVHVTISARQGGVQLGFTTQQPSTADSKSKSSPVIHSGQEALLMLIRSLAQQAQIQFQIRRNGYFLIFSRSQQLPLITEQKVSNEVKKSQKA